MNTLEMHPLALQAKQSLDAGRIGRREFLRMAGLLGVSGALVATLAGIASPVGAAEPELPFPAGDPKAKAGGILRAAMRVGELDDPATFDRVELGNQVRHVIEHIALIGPDNITRPMLAESWSASDDLTTWTINIRQGVLWHNGEELVAEHVAWNVRRWLEPGLAAGGIVGLSTFAAMLDDAGAAIQGAVETIDTYTLRFKLKRPVLSVMEDCAQFQTAICHPSFISPLSDNPIGTGPFTLAENLAGEVCILSRVAETGDGQLFQYWGGEVFLDEIHYYDPGSSDGLSTYAAGDVDFVPEIGRKDIEAAKALEAQILVGQSARTLVCRMQVNRQPFADIRVREAFVRAVDNAAIKDLIFPLGGDVGENHQVAPIHPDYSRLEPLSRDVDRAWKLLVEAGYPEGIETSILVADSDDGWHRQVCEAMAEQMREAGIILTVNPVPPADFPGLVSESAFAAVPWPHQPLGTMALSLAYRAGEPLNGTHFGDPDFESALDEAEATLDMEKRRSKMQKAERILQNNFLMVQPLFAPNYAIAAARLKDLSVHPALEHHFNKVWVG